MEMVGLNRKMDQSKSSLSKTNQPASFEKCCLYKVINGAFPKVCEARKDLYRHMRGKFGIMRFPVYVSLSRTNTLGFAACSFTPSAPRLLDGKGEQHLSFSPIARCCHIESIAPYLHLSS